MLITWFALRGLCLQWVVGSQPRNDGVSDAQHRITKVLNTEALDLFVLLSSFNSLPIHVYIENLPLRPFLDDGDETLQLLPFID